MERGQHKREERNRTAGWEVYQHGVSTSQRDGTAHPPTWTKTRRLARHDGVVIACEPDGVRRETWMLSPELKIEHFLLNVRSFGDDGLFSLIKSIDSYVVWIDWETR